MDSQSSEHNSSRLSDLTNTQPDLFEAARRGDVGRIQALITEGVDVNSLDNEGYSALFYATKSFNIDEILALINSDDEAWRFPTTEQSNLDAIRILIAGGANPNQADSNGYTPLLYNALGGSLDARAKS